MNPNEEEQDKRENLSDSLDAFDVDPVRIYILEIAEKLRQSDKSKTRSMIECEMGKALP